MQALVTGNIPPTWRSLNVSYPSAFMNLAVEEAMARVFSVGVQTQPTIRLWTNPRAVVIGRFQRAPAEVDIAQCDLSGVQVARRFTGGGSVFHDEGTLNFTLVNRRSETLPLQEFQEINLRLVVEALECLGLQASVFLPNSVLIDGRKVCGAAAAVGMHFTLWHCSILVDTNTRLLELALAPSKSTTPSQFVRSKWHSVTTVAKALSKPISVGEVARSLERSVEENFGELEAKPLSAEEERCSEALYGQKYSLDEWNLKGEVGFVWDEEKVERITQQLPCEFAQHP